MIAIRGYQFLLAKEANEAEGEGEQLQEMATDAQSVNSVAPSFAYAPSPIQYPASFSQYPVVTMPGFSPLHVAPGAENFSVYPQQTVYYVPLTTTQ